MFEIGWTEMLVIAVVMIVIVGPKDLPNMLRTFGRTTAKLRAMAGDFQKQFNEALKEAELDDVKKSIDTLRDLNPAAEIKKQLNPFEKAAADVRAGLDGLKPAAPKPADPAAPVAQPAEPLKNGATQMPGVSGPEAMPSASPVFPPMADPAVSAAAAAPVAAAPAQPIDMAAAMTGTARPVAGPSIPAAVLAEPQPVVVARKPRAKAAADRLVETPPEAKPRPAPRARAKATPVVAAAPVVESVSPTQTVPAKKTRPAVAAAAEPVAAKTPVRKKTAGPAA